MVNHKLEENIDNSKGHIIFESQLPEDLEELKTILKERNEIVIDFPLLEWKKAKNKIMLEPDEKQLQAARNYITAKILTELEKKYPELEKYNGKMRLDYFIEMSDDEYWKHNKSFYNFDNIKEMLDIENIKVDRIHIIMNGNNSNILCNAVSILLRDDNPYNVSIYTAPNGYYTIVVPDDINRPFLSETYNYTIFNELDKGKVNTANKQIISYGKL